MSVRMPESERKRLKPGDELNILRAAYYLGIGRTTLSRLLDQNKVRHARLSEHSTA